MKDTIVTIPSTPGAHEYHDMGAELLPLSIAWESISFDVEIKEPETKQLVTKEILKNVSGEAVPGELVVLMGPSGAGKSSLLDCISGRNTNCSGTVVVNGRPWTKAMVKHTCYVMQDDMFYANLTVLEHLTFQAHLRMGKSKTAAEREDRVRTVISELGLTKVTNTPIGSAVVKGLSGGQRKRLSFATELLTNPSLLFVDEPTSGLDSFMAETVVRQMRDLARRGRTVIATIHQPASDLFELFDRLYLLVDGATVYNGKASESIAYFAKQGLQCPSFMNPTDYFMKQLVVMDDQPEARQRVDNLVTAWAAHETHKSEPGRADAHVRQPVGGENESESSDSLGFGGQVAVLCKRNVMRMFRDVVGFRARIGSTLIVSIIAGLVSLQLDKNQKGIQDFTGAMFFLCTFQMMSTANPEFLSVPLEIPLILREHNGGIYHTLTWYLAKNVSELPMQLVFPMLFLLPAYFMIGFGGGASVFATFYFFMVLLCSAATGAGLMVACMAKRVDIAPVLGILILLPFLLFGGLFLNTDSTPVYFVWLQHISPIMYAFHGVMRAFWNSVDSIACKPDQRCSALSGAQVLEANSIPQGKMWRDALLLVVVNVGFRLVGAMVLFGRVTKKTSGAKSKVKSS
ncbi:TPA: hypothetical protein N0F65_005078 [Lagenidium giganteum]|uniref:ABC transporter domain-containing protein n=1 Tax=Lagenidium giganteum TaxID=4803 RepID=A0AAV2YKK4_9STRA|nr:TPA: hypothetical protein N0F65_005078 [Lagenidium giganteum]